MRWRSLICWSWSEHHTWSRRQVRHAAQRQLVVPQQPLHSKHACVNARSPKVADALCRSCMHASAVLVHAGTRRALAAAAAGRHDQARVLYEQLLDEMDQLEEQQVQQQAQQQAQQQPLTGPLLGPGGLPSKCELGLIYSDRLQCLELLGHWEVIQQQVRVRMAAAAVETWVQPRCMRVPGAQEPRACVCAESHAWNVRTAGCALVLTRTTCTCNAAGGERRQARA